MGYVKAMPTLQFLITNTKQRSPHSSRKPEGNDIVEEQPVERNLKLCQTPFPCASPSYRRSQVHRGKHSLSENTDDDCLKTCSYNNCNIGIQRQNSSSDL